MTFRISTTTPNTATRTMTAALIDAPGSVRMIDAPLPIPGPGQVRVRLERCGVCASNLPPWQGRPWFQYPFAPGQLGHKGWGRVDAVGDGVRALAAGDRADAQVIALGRRRFAMDVAQRMGADHTVPLDDHDQVIQRMRELTAERWCDMAIEATGKSSPLDVIHAHERDPQVYRAGMQAAVRAIAEGRPDPAPLYTHVLKLNLLGEPLNLTQDRPEGFLKALGIPGALGVPGAVGSKRRTF